MDVFVKPKINSIMEKSHTIITLTNIDKNKTYLVQDLDGKKKLVFTFIEQLYPEMKSLSATPFKGGGKLLIPPDEVKKAERQIMATKGPVGMKKMGIMKNVIEGWCAVIYLIF